MNFKAANLMEGGVFKWGSLVAFVVGLLGSAEVDLGSLSPAVDAVGPELLAGLGAAGRLAHGLLSRIRERSNQIAEMHSAVMSIADSVFKDGLLTPQLEERLAKIEKTIIGNLQV